MLKGPAERWLGQLDVSGPGTGGQGRLSLARLSLMASDLVPRAQQDSNQHSPGKAAQLWEHVHYPLGTGDRVECNLAVHVQRLKTTTGSSGTCCCAMESSKGCWRRMAWQQRTGGTSGHIFSCRQHRMGLLLGRGREAGTGREKLWVQMSTLYTQFLRALEIK